MSSSAQRSPFDTTPLKHIARIRSSNVDKIINEHEMPVQLCNYVDVYYNERITSGITFSSGSATRQEIARFALRPGDVLITKDSETPTDIAVPALVLESATGVICGYHLALLRPISGRANSGFLFWALKADPVRGAFSARAQGITRFGLTLGGIGSIPIPTPDLMAQRTIANFLDRETARIDFLIEKKKCFLKLADERWRSTLDDSICGRGLRSPRVPIRHMAIDAMPAHWSLSPLKYLTDDNRQIMYGIVLPGPNVEEGALIVKGGDVKPGRLDPERLCKTTFEIESGYARSRLKAGDLVIAIRGGIGDIEIVPPEIEGANLTQDAARIAPRISVHNVWLRYALQAPSVFAPLEAKALGAAVRGVNIFDLKRVQIPTPPTEEQVAIAKHLDSKARQIAVLREKIGTHAEAIREFRSALITAAVTGQIDVVTWGKRGEPDRRLDRIEEEMSLQEARV